MSVRAETGVDVRVITKVETVRLGGAISPTRKIFMAAKGSVLNRAGKHKIKLISAWVQSKKEAYVLEGAKDKLLGKPDIRKFRLI